MAEYNGQQLQYIVLYHTDQVYTYIPLGTYKVIPDRRSVFAKWKIPKNNKLYFYLLHILHTYYPTYSWFSTE